jgi:hypothetical protein
MAGAAADDALDIAGGRVAEQVPCQNQHRSAPPRELAAEVLGCLRAVCSLLEPEIES